MPTQTFSRTQTPGDLKTPSQDSSVGGTQGPHTSLCLSSSVMVRRALGLATQVSLCGDPALHPAIPALGTSLSLSYPISPSDLHSAQLSEQSGIKSRIQEWKLTLCLRWLQTLTPLDGGPARKPSSVRTACQGHSDSKKTSILQLTEASWILSISSKQWSMSNGPKCIYPLTSCG